MTMKTEEESKKRSSGKRELTKFKLKSLQVIRKMLRLIGLGKSLKRKKIVKN